MNLVDRHPTDWRRAVAAARSDRRVRSLLVALAAGVILITLIGATNSVVGAARSISNDARALSETDEEIRAATVARTLTVLSAVAVADGTTPPAVDEIDQAVDILAGDSRADTRRFIDAVDEVTTVVETGRAPLPEQVAEVENAFGELIDRLVLDREDLADALTASESRLNQISSLAGLALLFVVPTLAIGVYRAISRPDAEQRALAHAAAIDHRLNEHRRRAVAEGIRDARQVIAMKAPAAVVDQRLAEATALAGVGADGTLRRRRRVDLRTAAASAINRTEMVDALAVTGGASPVVADEDQVVALLASLLGTVAGRRNPSLQLRDDGEHATLTMLTADAIPDLERLDDPQVFGAELDSSDARRVAAARELATDLGASVQAFDDGAHTGFVVRFRRAELASDAIDLAADAEVGAP
ncbi:MAG: hypothetical protein AAF081_11085 [Actinomycetota bacterium]